MTYVRLLPVAAVLYVSTPAINASAYTAESQTPVRQRHQVTSGFGRLDAPGSGVSYLHAKAAVPDVDMRVHGVSQAESLRLQRVGVSGAFFLASVAVVLAAAVGTFIPAIADGARTLTAIALGCTGVSGYAMAHFAQRTP